MALKIGTKFEGKLTCASKNDLRNFENFHQSTFEVWKFGLVLGPFIKNRKCVILQFTEGLCVIKIKNDAKIEETWLANSKSTWRIWWFFIWALENLKNFHFNRLLLTKEYNVWAKKSTEELLFIALQIDAKFEGKLTCTF